jgi:hypothetical protein
MYCENNLNEKYWAKVGPKLSKLMGSGLMDSGVPRGHC